MTDDDLDKKIQRLQHILVEKYKSAGIKFPFNLNRSNYEEFRTLHPNINDDGVDTDKVIEMVHVMERRKRVNNRIKR